MIKRTLQEIADFFDVAAAMDDDGSWYLYTAKPSLVNGRWCCGNGNVLCGLSRDLVDYSGDWRESLTLPDSWTKELPFKEGELAYGSDNTGPYIMTSDRMINAAWYRRPTEAEWKTLRGEE